MAENRTPSENTGDSFDLNIGGATGRTSIGSTASAASQAATDAATTNAASNEVDDVTSQAVPGAKEGPGNVRQEKFADRQPQPNQPPPRQPKAERPNSFNVVAWLAEGAFGLAEELRHNDLGLPADFWSHAYAAQREGLLAAQTLLDHLIEYTEKKSKPGTAKKTSSQRRGSITIE